VTKEELIAEELEGCECPCHGMVLSLEHVCTVCKELHIEFLRQRCLDTAILYKELNKEFVHTNVAAGELKAAIKEILEEFKKDLHVHSAPGEECKLCKFVEKLLEITKQNKIGDRIIRLLKDRHQLVQLISQIKMTEELTCPRCDENQPLKDCACQEIEEARLDARETLDNFYELVTKDDEAK